MMKKYLSLFFILLSMACSKKNRITELKMPPVIHLTGEKVETILPRCYETGVLVDSFLVLKEKCTDTMFYLFSTNTDREIFRFGREGRGVCEFYYPFFLVNSFAYDSLIIYEPCRYVNKNRFSCPCGKPGYSEMRKFGAFI